MNILKNKIPDNQFIGLVLLNGFAFLISLFSLYWGIVYIVSMFFGALILLLTNKEGKDEKRS